MYDHIGLKVGNLDAAVRFYTAARGFDFGEFRHGCDEVRLGNKRGIRPERVASPMLVMVSKYT